jgi:acyl-CoA thioesterase II
MPICSMERTCVASSASDAETLGLDDALSVEAVGVDRFVAGATPAAFDRLYGGQVLAQSFLAAAATVEPDRRLHSLHAYFQRLGAPDQPVIFDIERLADTRSFSTRFVRAAQAPGLLTTALLSFHRPDTRGFVHADAMPAVAPPEDFESRDDRLRSHYHGDPPANAGVGWPVEIRYVDREPWSRQPSDGRNRMWIRVRPRAEATDRGSPVLRSEGSTSAALTSAASLLFASDLTMFEPVIARHDIAWDELIAGTTMFGATLDHSFWLHREFTFDDWLLHVHESTVAANGRGLTTGRFYSRDGELVASVAQEIVVKTIARRAS